MTRKVAAAVVTVVLLGMVSSRLWLRRRIEIDRVEANARPGQPFDTCEKRGRPGEKNVWIGLGTLDYCDGVKGLLFAWEKREHYVLYVPSARRWPREFPSWAHERRDEILEDINQLTAARGWAFRFEEFD